jgi:hypothetical protein
LKGGEEVSGSDATRPETPDAVFRVDSRRSNDARRMIAALLAVLNQDFF